jgi:tetratricopeptide (TPR) repeat protein
MVISSSPTPAVPPAPQPGPVTSSPQPSSTGGSRHNIREQPTNSNSARTPSVGGSSDEGKPRQVGVLPSETPSASRERNQIDSEKAHRIGGSIGKENPAAPAVAKQSSIVTSSRTASDRADRIGVSNNDEGSSVAPTTNSPVISLSRTSRIGSPIGREKSNGRAREKRSSADSGEAVIVDKAGQVSSSIGMEEPSASSTDSQGNANRHSNHADSQRIRQTDGKSLAKPEAFDKDAGRRDDAIHKQPDVSPQHADRKPAGSRLDRRASENQKAVIDNFDGDKTRIRRSERIGSSHVVYDDCPELISHSRHHEQIYIDSHEQVCHRTIWPESYFSVYYNWGPSWTFRYVYPYYHRKYVFVSLGGYWPVEYTCVRYYWYGCHPYIWSGYYPIPYEVQGDTYNYYTYNYYTYNYPSTEAETTATAEPVETTNYIRPVDENTFADVREKLAKQQAAKPDREMPADAYFEAAVKAFEIYDYDTAIEKFAKAIEFAPDDMILPFAYAQALLADERYVEAAGVLRAALAKVSPDKEEVFYPRGLYPSDDILFEQIDRLDEKTKLYSFDADLQLLLGYQLLGVGEIDQAVKPLRLAGEDLENASAATVLLNVLEKVRADPDVSGQNTN